VTPLLAGLGEFVDRRITRARRQDPRRVTIVRMRVVASTDGSADLADDETGDATAPGVDVVAGQAPNVGDWVRVAHVGGQPTIVLM